MALKLIFKLQREDYSQGSWQENNNRIKTNLNNILNDKGITITHIHTPARNSVKVIFPTDGDIDKVMKNAEAIKNEGFEPRMSLSLKACRTIFCTNFDPALLITYSKDDIIDILKQQKWEVKDIYIMKSNKSFKVEMKTRKQAQKFINMESINIGGIRLTNNSREPEIDPTIQQCWECGVLNPTHNSQGCTNTRICIKCGERGHKFYECTIPKEIIKMTEEQKAKRYCAACKSRGTHTTLDHRQCPRKREILRERAMLEREKLVNVNEKENRDVELIRKAINFNNNEGSPININQTPQQSAITTIVTLALIDEANNQGIFENKLKDALENNNLPVVKYKLEPDTARKFQRILTGTHIRDQTPSKKNGAPTTTKYYRDHKKNKRNASYEDQTEEEDQDTIIRKDKKPRKIMVSTQKGITSSTMEHEYKETFYDKNKAMSSKSKTPEEIYSSLKEQLNKYIIMIETENDIETETETKSLSLEKILEFIISNKIMNNTEWTLLIKDYLEKLITLGHKDRIIDIKIQEINIESIEVSILRHTEREKSFEIEKLFLDSSESEEDEYRQSDTSDDIFDEYLKNLTTDNQMPTNLTERTSSYPLEYYVRSGTFSE